MIISITQHARIPRALSNTPGRVACGTGRIPGGSRAHPVRIPGRITLTECPSGPPYLQALPLSHAREHHSAVFFTTEQSQEQVYSNYPFAVCTLRQKGVNSKPL